MLNNGNKVKISVVTKTKPVFKHGSLFFSNKGKQAMRCFEAKVSNLKISFRKLNNLNIKKMKIPLTILVLMEKSINCKKTHCVISLFSNSHKPRP